MEILDLAKAMGGPLVLPVDHVVTQRIEAGAPTKVVEEIEAGWMGVDIGPRTRELFAAKLCPAKTAFWNGPLGIFGLAGFDEGTRAMAQTFAAITAGGAVTIVGGGDSAAAIRQLGFEAQVSHVSTGGGAALELFEGKFLPGIAALDLKEQDPPNSNRVPIEGNSPHCLAPTAQGRPRTRCGTPSSRR